MAEIRPKYETFIGEELKSAAERSLELLGGNPVGRKALELYASNGHGRIFEEGLFSELCGIGFENPIIVGAGWDEKGRAIHGLYALGFGGVEVGTVTPFYQYGNEKPRLWTIDRNHGVGFNRLGFNSAGDEVVADYLYAAQPLPCPIGLNVGRNKVTPNEMAGRAHARVIACIGHFASYIVLAISSPNTKDLRGLQAKGPFRELLQSARAVMPAGKPLFVKIDAERSKQEINDMIEVGLEEGLSGFVACNTYMGKNLKFKYGDRWVGEAGGLSGADPEYRKLTTATVRHIHEEAGDKLYIVGVGAVNSSEAALDKIKAGASITQVVTAIRESRGKVAAAINAGLLLHMKKDGVSSIMDYVGVDTRRGAKSANIYRN